MVRMTLIDGLKDRLDNVWSRVNERRDYTPEMLTALEGVEAEAIGAPCITRDELIAANQNGEQLYDGEAGAFLFRLDLVYDGLREIDNGRQVSVDRYEAMNRAVSVLEAAAGAL